MVDTPLAEVYGKVLLPALAQAKTERNRGDLDFDKERRVYRAARSVLTGVLAARRPVVTEAPKLFVIGCAAEGVGDRLALAMLRDLVMEAGGEMAVVPATKLTVEIEGRMQGGRPVTVCVAALAPGGLSRAARLCEQVRAGKTGVRVVVGRWGAEPEAEADEKLLRSAGATQVTWTLSETLKEVVPADHLGSMPGAASRKPVIV
jgi:hypothetical protein